MSKIALVTGGSRGLGKSAAQSLAQKGIDVIITYHSKRDEAEAVVREIEDNGGKSVALQLDAGLVSSFDEFVASLNVVLQEKWNTDRFDYLINNAGFGNRASIETTTEEQFDNLLNVHFKGVFFLTQKLVPHLAEGGSIVNISTGLTRFVGPGYAAYASVKGAVEILTKYMAKELGDRGIRVNTVAPGAIATDFGDGTLKTNQQVRDYMSSVNALGRVGEAEDIGGIIASLCSTEMGWVTAQRIEASGGMNL